MEPLRIEGTTPEYVLVHRCTLCGKERRNRISKEDSPDAIVALAAKNAAQ
jgi:hypothetical protein